MRQGLRSHYHGSPELHLQTCLKIMFWVSQRINFYISERCFNADPPVPNFSDLTNAVRSRTMGSTLGDLPLSWMEAEKKDDKPEKRVRGGGGDAPSTRVQNLHPDEDLQRRWRNSGHSTLTAMTEGLDPKPTMPKMSGVQICLMYHLKGQCKSACPRAKTHKHAGAEALAAMNTYLDQCGVASA
jgi:hypothetical protein